jgi:hypothetical protein
MDLIVVRIDMTGPFPILHGFWDVVPCRHGRMNEATSTSVYRRKVGKDIGMRNLFIEPVFNPAA